MASQKKDSRKIVKDKLWVVSELTGLSELQHNAVYEMIMKERQDYITKLARLRNRINILITKAENVSNH